MILETSGKVGQVALARGSTLVGGRRLDETRRHARDLAPAVAELLTAQGWQPRDVQGVIVSKGPGSYTGLRVGIMSAKAFAYVTGCALLGVDTFAAIAAQVPQEAVRLDVLADAQQDNVYVQTFVRSGAEALPDSPLTIRSFSEWLASLEPDRWLTGPGLVKHQDRLPSGCRLVEAALWDPRPESLLCLGLARYSRGERDDLWTLEPLYLRPSSAEQKWEAKAAPK